MGFRQLLSVLFISALAAGGACAMERGLVLEAKCSVIGGEKIFQAVGGSETLCQEVRSSLARVAQGPSARVVVQARRTHLTAKITLTDGRKLPEIGLAMSDAPISIRSIQKFAAQISNAVVEAGL